VYTYGQCFAEFAVARRFNRREAHSMYPHCRTPIAATVSVWCIWALIVCNSSALATTTFWNTVNSGNFSNSANWDHGVPGASDTAVFREGTGATYTVTFNGTNPLNPPVHYFSDRLIVGNNEVTFVRQLSGADYSIVNATTAEAGRGIVVGELGGVVLDTATLTTTFPIFGAAATLADAPETTGTLNVSGGTFNLSGNSEGDHELFIANHGAGTLNVSNGGVVLMTGTSADAVIGNHSDSNGSANISGAGSAWTIGSTLVVGGDGMGTLMITQSSNVSDKGATIGQAINSHGSATVTGAGSSWNHANRTFAVGGDGTGTLTISSGGSVSDDSGFVADFDHSTGTATISGAGSTWSSTSFFAVAQFGHGTATIEAGGAVSTSIGFIATQLGSNGSVSVTGTGSSFTTTGNFVVGFEGTADLKVLAGGSMSSHNTWLAGATTSTSTATVSGTGSSWTIAGRLAISEAFDPVELGPGGGTGTLAIQPGAVVSVAQDTALFPGATLKLEGGTFDTQSVSFQGGGVFNWTSGTLHVVTFNGDLLNQGGKLAPGHSVGTTTINGNYTQNAGALDIELGGTNAGQSDKLNVTGTATLGGALNVTFTNGFVPQAGNTFDILDWAARSGTFVSLNLPGGGLTWNTSQLYVTGVLSAGGVVGDYNRNGTVDTGDYVVWRKALGQSGAGLAADGNFNGQVDQGDFDIWRVHFGQTAGSGSGAITNFGVPEPETLALLLTAAGWYLRPGGTARKSHQLIEP
jgi:T5SS/PEP-CTERM-associated repeat protein